MSDFSRDLLQKASGLGAIALEECGWSDWGTPERVLECLRHHDDHATLTRRLAVALLTPRAPEVIVRGFSIHT